MFFSLAAKRGILLLLSSTSLVLSKPFFFWDKADNQGLIPRGGLANGAELRVLCLGASITYGWESSSGDGYRYALRGALANNGNAVTMIGSLRGGTMENNQVEGWIGFRIDQVAQKAELSLPQMPNVVLVNAGLNDADQDYQISTAHLRMAALVDRIHQVVPNAVVIVSTLLPNRDPRVQANINIINGNYRSMVASKVAAGEKVSLVEFSSDWFSLADLQQSDGSHPTDEGYLKLAKIFYNGIVAASGQITSPIHSSSFTSLASQNDPGAGTALETICQGVTGALAVEVQCAASAPTSASSATEPTSMPATTALPVVQNQPAPAQASTEAPSTTTTVAPLPTTSSSSVRSTEAPSTISSTETPTTSSEASSVEEPSSTLTLPSSTLSSSIAIEQSSSPASSTTTSESSSSAPASSTTASESSSSAPASSTSTSISSVSSSTIAASPLVATTSPSSSSPTPTKDSGASRKSIGCSLPFGIVFAFLLL